MRGGVTGGDKEEDKGMRRCDPVRDGAAQRHWAGVCFMQGGNLQILGRSDSASVSLKGKDKV